MRVGIIGTNWGRTHIGTFRRGGADVVVLVGTDSAATAAIAAEEGVAVGTADAGALEDVDVVVVASPTPTHVGFVEQFAHKPVLCEKPIVGGRAEPAFAARVDGSQIWVNYAFGFLATAAAARDHVLSRRVAEVELRVAVDLPNVADAVTAWKEVAVHPLAFVSQLFGPFETASHDPQGDAFEAVLENTHHRVRARVESAARPGIDIDVVMAGDGVRVEMRGGYHPGEGWAFAPLRVDGSDVGPAERSADGRDVWYEANCRAVGAFLSVVRGELSRTEAAERGLVHATAALAFERVLEPDG